MTSGKWKTVFAPIFGVTLLVTILFLSDPGAIIARLRGARLDLILLGLLLVQIQIVLSALRWGYTAARLGHRLPLRRAVTDYYLGSLANMVLPGGMAGDVMRTARNRSADRSWGIPVMAVMMERFAGQIALVVIGCAGLIAWPFLNGGLRPSEAFVLLSVFLGLAVLAAAATLLAWLSGSPWWRRLVQKIGRGASACYGLPYAWLVQGVLSLTIVASYIAVFALASAAIGASLPAIGLLTIVPVCLLTMIVPVTIGGWGTREAAAAALWPLLGMTADQGVAASVMYGIIVTAGALPGLLTLVMPGVQEAGRAPFSRRTKINISRPKE